MSVTAQGRKPSKRYAIAHGLAPHVDEVWAGSLLLELRLLGVAGDRIGAAVSEVESHCTESGQSAQEAFGDPVEYAQSLQLPEATDNSTQAITRSLTTILVQVLGMWLLNWSFEDWIGGQQLELTVGRLVSSTACLLAVVALVRFTDPLLRALVRRPIASGVLAYLACMAAFVIPLLLLDVVIWRGSAGLGVALGAAVLVGGVAWAIARLRTHGAEEEDPITSPFEDAGTSADDNGPKSRGGLFGSSLLSTLTYTAMIPAGTVILLAMTWVLYLMSPQ
jgi:hypothetical protein